MKPLGTPLTVSYNELFWSTFISLNMARKILKNQRQCYEVLSSITF